MITCSFATAQWNPQLISRMISIMTIHLADVTCRPTSQTNAPVASHPLPAEGKRCLVLQAHINATKRSDKFLHARVATYPLNFPRSPPDSSRGASLIVKKQGFAPIFALPNHTPSPIFRVWPISQICLFSCSPSDQPPAQLARLSLSCSKHLMPCKETSKWLLRHREGVRAPTLMNTYMKWAKHHCPSNLGSRKQITWRMFLLSLT